MQNLHNDFPTEYKAFLAKESNCFVRLYDRGNRSPLLCCGGRVKATDCVRKHIMWFCQFCPRHYSYSKSYSLFVQSYYVNVLQLQIRNKINSFYYITRAKLSKSNNVVSGRACGHWSLSTTHQGRTGWIKLKIIQLPMYIVYSILF